MCSAQEDYAATNAYAHNVLCLLLYGNAFVCDFINVVVLFLLFPVYRQAMSTQNKHFDADDVM